MAVGDAYVFPGFLTPVPTQLFFPKPPTTFLTCFCRGERRKYAGKKSCLNRGSNSQPPGHESDTLTTEPLGGGLSRESNQLPPSREVLHATWTQFFKKRSLRGYEVSACLVSFWNSIEASLDRLNFALEFPWARHFRAPVEYL